MQLINYGKQFVDNRDILSVKKVLLSNYLTQGPKVQLFEKSLLKFLGGKYCTAVSSGTAALHLLAIACNWKKNDIILTTPVSFLATANCIVYTGANPVFVDIEEKTGNICVKKLEIKIKQLKKKNKKIKAIIAMDYAGFPCNWKELKRISKKYNLTLINDNCHAVGTTLNGSHKYAIKYADFVTLSFHPVKSITTAEGGAIISKSKRVNNIIKSLRSHGIEKKDKKGLWFYEMQRLGYNYRISDIHSALGISQLQKIKQFIKKRRKIAKIYNKAFKDLLYIQTPRENNNVNSSYHLYPLRIKFNKFKISKKNFFLKLLKMGIKLQVHYIPIYKQPFYKKNFKNKTSDFKMSEKFYSEVVSLPVYFTLKEQTQKKIIKNILKLLKL